MKRRRHGVRLVHPVSMLEEVMSTLGAGQRLDILRCLADQPKHVTLLAKELFLDVKLVSKDLERLESTGLVVCTRVSTKRVYELTRRVKALRRGELVQLVVETSAGRWLLVNFDDASSRVQSVAPPARFVRSQQR